ncbi:putative SapB synthase [Streptomyces sp. enrichment culture]
MTRATELLDHVRAEKWHRLGHDLDGGLAGLGLVLDALGARSDDTTLHDLALRAADLTAGALDKLGDSVPRPGLLHGATGPALLFLRLYERTGDTGLLDLAADALRRDLQGCVGDNGSLYVAEGARLMPYLGSGSIGIAAVVDDYLLHRPSDSTLDTARHRILPAARSRFYAQPGLLRGRAGMVWHLARTTVSGVTAADVEQQLDAMNWYALSYGGGLAFPGEQMMRLSMDLFTGTAGCLLAIGSARHTAPVSLPFLPPLPRPQ